MKLFGRQYDTRRIPPILVIVAFMAVTIGHVAVFAGRYEQPKWQWLGWPYAFAVDFSIFICAYFTKWNNTKRWAWVGYFSFTVASGVMNASAIEFWSQPMPFSAGFLALFPTGAISLMGFLYRQVDRLASTAEAKATRALEDRSSHGCWCGFSASSEMSLRAHSKRHLNEIKKAPNAQEALRFLMDKYPASYSEEWEGPAPPTLPLIASIKEKSR